jgi:hypothetical protein
MAEGGDKADTIYWVVAESHPGIPLSEHTTDRRQAEVWANRLNVGRPTTSRYVIRELSLDD